MPTNEKILEFVSLVCENIKYKSIHKSISDEIENHILESIDFLKETGLNEEQAIDKAIKQMGSPKTIGKNLNHIHNPKIKILKYISILLLIILIFFIISTARNMIIILNMQNKISIYQEKTNIYAKTSTYQGDLWQVSEYLIKDNNYIYTLYNISKDSNLKLIQYSPDGINENMYFDAPDSKFVVHNTKEDLPLLENSPVVNYLETNSFIELLRTSIVSSIKSEKCNGKKCYYMRNLLSSNILYNANGKFSIYIDKETGLPVRVYCGTATSGDSSEPLDVGNTYDCIMDYIYKFDILQDTDIVEPDISEYEIVEN